MSNPMPPLPAAWLERLFAVLRATYGAEFDRQWETPAGAEPAEHVRTVMAVWGRKLAAVSPASIAWALEHLPPRPPNLIEFRALCNGKPESKFEALPPAKLEPELLEKRRAAVNAVREQLVRRMART